jgi:Fic-DOC domain mobile mystery protein B
MSEDGATAGATAGEDLSGLLRLNLAQKRDRDAAEFQSIARAYDKHVFRARRKKPGEPWLTEPFLRRVHRDMFGDVWAWAGKYRTSSTNIGVDSHAIPEHVARLCGDFRYWDSPEGKMAPLEIAARLQNRLTRIHPFTNGNGRHARLITDVFFRERRLPLPRWPQVQLIPEGREVRRAYISAMRKADAEDYGELMAFIGGCMKTAGGERP